MPTGQMSKAVQHLRRAVLWADGAGLSDGQLLEHFIERRDEAAFESLVRRHGPMVLGVCRRLLRNYHDADDAFQATFLILVRKAASIAPKEMVGSWLYGVAYQTALKGRAVAAKRQSRERQVALLPEGETKSHDLWHDLQGVLDLELKRLPHKYRAPFVLCDLEGKSYKEAARRLGWPEGTLSVRLARARQLLAKRLTRHGFSITGAALAAVLSENAASACVPPSLASSTIKAAILLAAGQATAVGVVSGEVAALTKGVLKTMLVTKIKTAMAVALTVSIVGLGGSAVSYYALVGEAAGARDQLEKPSQAVKRIDEHANKKDEAQTDNEKLQGFWKLVKLEALGMLFDEVTMENLGDLTINGNGLGSPGHGNSPCQLWSGGVFYSYTLNVSPWHGTYKLNATNKPKRITITQAPNTSKLHGIYSLDDDTLRLCLNADGTDTTFPSDFKTKEGSPFVFVTFKREKPADHHKANEPAKPGNSGRIGDSQVRAVDKARQQRLFGEWVGKDPDGIEFTLLFGIKNFSQLDAEDGRHFSGTYTVDFEQTPHHLDFHWTEPIGRFPTGTIRTIMEFKDGGQLRIELASEGKPRPEKFTDNSAVLTKRMPVVGAKEGSKSDKEKMQGVWQVIGGEEGSQKLDADEFGLITIRDDIMTLPLGEPSPVSFKLDPTKKPKRITIILKSLGTDAKMNGIYSLDGDDLKFCFASKGDDVPPPKNFDTEPGSEQRLFILKRLKPPMIEKKQTKANGSVPDYGVLTANQPPVAVDAGFPRPAWDKKPAQTRIFEDVARKVGMKEMDIFMFLEVWHGGARGQRFDEAARRGGMKEKEIETLKEALLKAAMEGVDP